MLMLKIAKSIVQEPRYVEACKVIAEAEAEEARKAEAEAVIEVDPGELIEELETD